MALGTYDGQTAGITYLLAELDIGTTAGHVGGNGDGAREACLCNNVGLFLVQLGIEHVVWDFAYCEQAAEQLGDFYRCRTHKYRAASLYKHVNLLDYGIVLLALCLVDAVVHILARNGAVGWYNHHIELVDIPEFACLGLGSTGHTGQLVVHAEVILQCDGGECLCGCLHLHALLGLDGLVQTVGVAASLHNTAGLLVDNLNLSVFRNNVFNVAVEHCICLEQLVYGVYALRLD